MARRLHEDACLQSMLEERPPEATTIPTVHCSEVDQSVAARCEPLVIQGATASWHAAHKWSSESALQSAYGELNFNLGAGAQFTLRGYLQYAAESTADYPFYIAERSFSGLHQQVGI